MSERPSTRWLSSCSGAMYSGVPTTMPEAVIVFMSRPTPRATPKRIAAQTAALANPPVAAVGVKA